MAYIDSNEVLSDSQNIYASGADVVSTNILDLAPHLAANVDPKYDFGPGEEAVVVATINTAVSGGTSIQPVLQTDTNTGFATAMVEFPLGPAVPVASAVAGYTWRMRIPASGLKRYLRIAWRNVGANTAGVGSASIQKDPQNNNTQSAGCFYVG